MTDLEQDLEPGGRDGPEGPEGEGLGPPPRRRWPLVAVAAVVVLGGLGVGLGVALGGSSSGPKGPEGVALQQVPDLASADTTAAGGTVDGIGCSNEEKQPVRYHIHDLLTVFVRGAQERIPAGAGIPTPRLTERFATGVFYDNGLSNCLYWLHTHTDDGVLHVESPFKHTFTLGQFFAVWQQPLGPDRVGPARGAVTAFENGRRFVGNPSDIPLLPHAVIQLDVGSPVVAFQAHQFTVAGLCGAGTQGCASGG